MKKALFPFFVLLAVFLACDVVYAQDSGGQDSTGLPGIGLRARRDTYIIETFPSPARRGQTIAIQFYNHNPQQLSLRIVDINDKTIKILQPQAMLANGIHSYQFPTNLVATGTYHIRLTTYSSTGAQSLVQDSRFIVLH